MAHFARIDENNKVTQVLVVPDEQEHRGEEYLNGLGLEGKWIQTSFNEKNRNIFAYTGAIYLPEKDVFVPAKHYPSWILDEDTLDWTAPIDKPQDGNVYIWNEENQNWVLKKDPAEESLDNTL